MRVAIPDRVDPHAFRRRDPGARIDRFDGETMGTNWSLLAVSPPSGTRSVVEQTLAWLIATFSHWDSRSAISMFNRSPIGEWCELPEPLAFVLGMGLDLWKRTDGAFDPAAGRLTDLWGFGPPGPRSAPPPDASIVELMAAGGARAIERDGNRARRLCDVTLDLSGIAKGYAVDALSQRLEASGVHDFLIEIGGEFVGRGIRPDGQPWWVELESPPGVDAPPLTIALHDTALATSGDYRRYMTHDGRRFGHTLDPRVGRPIDNDVVSVSALDRSCMMADAWATALTVLGLNQGTRFADANGLSARLVRSTGAESLSETMRAMID